MTTKTIEIRDKMTMMPGLIVRLDPGCEEDRWLFTHAGFGRDYKTQANYVLLLPIDGGSGRFECDPYDWPEGARTLRAVQQFVNEHFDDIASGDVVDVEFILGETIAPKVSERITERIL